MKKDIKFGIYIIIFLLLAQQIIAMNTIGISADIKSYSDIPNSNIFVGSLIDYNITITNLNNESIESIFDIKIIDPNGNSIHEIKWKTEKITPNNSVSFLPYIENGDFHLISPIKPGTYLLEVSSKENIKFFENKTIRIESNGIGYNKNFYRYKPNSIEFPFHTASLYEKNLIKINEKQYQESKQINEQILDYTQDVVILTRNLESFTWVILIATVIMLLVSVIQLFKK